MTKSLIELRLPIRVPKRQTKIWDLPLDTKSCNPAQGGGPFLVYLIGLPASRLAGYAAPLIEEVVPTSKMSFFHNFKKYFTN